MIVIHALDGAQVAIDENSVVLVAGPYPHDVGPHRIFTVLTAGCW